MKTKITEFGEYLKNEEDKEKIDEFLGNYHFFCFFVGRSGYLAWKMMISLLGEALICDSLVTRQKALTLQRKQYKGNV